MVFLVSAFVPETVALTVVLVPSSLVGYQILFLKRVQPKCKGLRNRVRKAVYETQNKLVVQTNIHLIINEKTFLPQQKECAIDRMLHSQLMNKIHHEDNVFLQLNWKAFWVPHQDLYLNNQRAPTPSQCSPPDIDLTKLLNPQLQNDQ